MKKLTLIKIGFTENPTLFVEDIKRKHIEIKGFDKLDRIKPKPNFQEITIFCKKVLTMNEVKKPLKQKIKEAFTENEEKLLILLEGKDVQINYSEINSFFSITCEEVRVDHYLNCISCT